MCVLASPASYVDSDDCAYLLHLFYLLIIAVALLSSYINRVGNFITIQQFQLGPETSTSSIQFREDYGMVLGVPKKTSASQNILPKWVIIFHYYFSLRLPL